MLCSAKWVPQQAYLPSGKGIIIEPPKPYAFGYDTTDEYGTTLQRSELGDGSGAVRGSYGYRDAQGLIRIVKYVADAGGFRAAIDTNEPGTAPENPADVLLNAKPILVSPKLFARQGVLSPLLNTGAWGGLGGTKLAQRWI